MKVYCVQYWGEYPEDGEESSPLFLKREDAESYLRDEKCNLEYYKYNSICECSIIESYSEYRKERDEAQAIAEAEEEERLKKMKEAKADGTFDFCYKRLRKQKESE